ncbi:MAG TPA: phosphatidylserine decarboxylase family protein [Gemmatimonadales bacterium]
MKVAPEGIPFIAIGLAMLFALVAVAQVAGGGWWYAAPAAWTPVAVWVPLFFRNPARRGPRGDRLIIAPADGLVVSVATVDESDFIGGPAVRVSVFMNVFNVHVNRAPVSGTAAYRQYRPGAFLNASLDKASERNEQMSLGIEAGGRRVLLRQIAGLIARRIVTDPRQGDPVRQGERVGLIRFGSRVDTFFPPTATARVTVGERTRAGMTVIAEWAE